MTWELALKLMVTYGPGAVKNLLEIIKRHPQPTAEAFDEIIALALKPMSEYIREAELRAMLK